MDIILEFESKLKNIGGEKVYSAREIMKIFGYDKWERFLGAISRAKDELNDKTKISQNFFYVIDKETGGRPKEDVLLTLGACYLVLKKCDSRKENVVKLLEYLKNILDEQKKLKENNRIFSWEKVYFTIFFIFLSLSFIYYFNTYFNYFNYKSNNSFKYNFDEINKKELVEKKKNEEEVFVKYDEKINDINQDKNKDINQENEAKNEDFNLILDEYINKKGDILIKFDESFNYRSDFVKTLTGENLISAYFKFGNNKIYRDSCSILFPKNCLSSSKSNLKSFSNFWEKTKNGYEILNLFKVDGYFGIDKNIYCVKYRYKLKYDTSNNYITEIFNYTTEIKNGYEQINGRYCEKIEKGGRNLSCPFKLNTYYCK